jgi:hypothetical protein
MSKQDFFLKLKDGTVCYKSDYIKAKTKDLIEFGYNITEDKISEQLEKCIKKEELDVIGMFIKADLL